MSLLRRALRSVGLRVGKDRYLVGTDLEGNAFYERPHPEYPDEWRKNKRYVEYRVTRYLSDYNFHTIPVQWSSWLRRTRRSPPSLTELETDFYRQLKLKENVEKLNFAYQEEKSRLLERDKDALLLSSSESELEQEGLPKDDVGIGKKEVEIGKNLGINSNSNSPSPDDTPATATAPATEKSLESTTTTTTTTEEDLVKESREQEREAARKRREEFARNAPPTGNPSDSFQPQAWSPQGPAKRR